MATYDEVDYSPIEEDTFNVWVELGARDPEQERFLEHSPLRRHVIQVKSSSPEAEDLIHEPLRFMLERGLDGVHEDSRVLTTVVNHHLGLRFRIIRATATVDEESGDVLLELHKQI